MAVAAWLVDLVDLVAWLAAWLVDAQLVGEAGKWEQGGENRGDGRHRAGGGTRQRC